MQIKLPELSLVVLIGPSGCGKSTFGRKHFAPFEVLSSDFCRGLASNNENDQAATDDAFDLLHYIAGKRLARGLLTVIDATNVQRESRQPLVALARKYHLLPVAIVLDMPERLCEERNHGRTDRKFGPHVIPMQRRQLRQSLRGDGLKREGFRHVFVLDTPEQIEAAAITREPLWNNLRHEHGPFDVIGDVHGCYNELVELLATLGYAPAGPAGAWSHPQQRKLIFVGDLVDRGPKSPEVVRLAIDSVNAGSALCVPGNHDVKFMRAIWGRQVQVTHGLAESLEQFKAYEGSYHGFGRVAAEFIDGLVSHYVLDDGKLVVAHAGLKEEMQGRGSGAVREFCLYGETTGETDDFGLPVRCNWAAEYRGRATVVYGHTPVPEAQWLNHTINIDTGCVFGGALTALRYPERELVSVPARQTYAEPARPFLPSPPESPDGQPPAMTAQQQHDDVLDIDDVLGKRIITTRLMHNVTVRQENAAAALEVMSRFAADPKWLIYLPPTMSPCETAQQDGYLEYPSDALAYFRHAGVPRVICEAKHMGSRAVVVVCKDAAAAARRFGVGPDNPNAGIIYTRTGRRFFDDSALEAQALDIVRASMAAAGLWDELKTDWVCLDCELLPWSAKAQALLKQQYAAVGAAAMAALDQVVAGLELASQSHADAVGLLERHRQRRQMATDYVAAYRRYCWPVNSIAELKLAPFHLLASEGRVHVDRDHLWHMNTLARLSVTDAGNGLLLATPYQVVDLADQASMDLAIAWWNDLTAGGGEGMVVKPLDFIAKGRKGLLQPAVKCRGREYLRIIYGPEYTAADHLIRLRSRHLAGKRSLALREFALGVEALERFVRLEPLRRVHECVFGVLAMESEPVDPRL